MSIVISSGHGLHIRGASDILDEVNEARRVVNKVAELLHNSNVPVTVFHDDVSTSQNENLRRIVDFHNAHERTLDVSIHFNSNGHDPSTPLGTECLYISQHDLAAKVARAVATAAHLPDRGPIKRDGLYFLKHTNKPSILIEVCFVTSRADAAAYREHFNDICQAIATSIAGQKDVPQPSSPEVVPSEELVLTDQEVIAICNAAQYSKLAAYHWHNRGAAPIGYVKGMAVAYGVAHRQYANGNPAFREMGKVAGRQMTDALALYRDRFNELGMSNETAGPEVLRHNYVMLVGLGIRESSGKHCEGRDMSASNASSDTAEAGLMQTSWNAHSCSPTLMRELFDYYAKHPSYGYMPIFAEHVSCSSNSWSSYGSGDGLQFQRMCKRQPTFAVETAAIVIRNLRTHYGTINRREVEIRPEADELFLQVETILAGRIA